ncbi:MAG: twin-arginine translocase subunit TatC, partial [Pseudomonadota bacterium]
VPVITVALVAAGLVTPEALAKARGYVVVGVFFIAMLITPPDVISQTLLALPVWALYELGIMFSRMLVRDNGQPESTESPTNPQ